MAFESLKVETTKEVSEFTKSRKETLKDIGAKGIDELQKITADLNQDWEGTKYFQKALIDLREIEREEAEYRALLNEIGAVSDEEVEEIWSAFQKREMEPEEEYTLTPEEAERWFDDGKNYFGKALDYLRKLLGKK